jgi:hypothetical protein
MKKLITAIPVLTLIFMVSCKKETSLQTGGAPGSGGGGNQPSGLLSKLVSKSGSDSTVLVFGYDASKRLISLNTSGSDSSGNFQDSRRFVRNAQGIITQIIDKNPDLAQFGLDSVVTRLDYNGRYTNRVIEINTLFVAIKDSTALSYDANGNIILEHEYTDYMMGGGYEETAKTEYTYSGNNISLIKVSSFDSTTASYLPVYNATYNYDAKTSPLILKNEGTAIGYSDFFSSNNVTQAAFEVPSDPSSNFTLNTTYTYNSDNKPITGTGVVQGGGTSTSSYFYQ